MVFRPSLVPERAPPPRPPQSRPASPLRLSLRTAICRHYCPWRTSARWISRIWRWTSRRIADVRRNFHLKRVSLGKSGKSSARSVVPTTGLVRFMTPPGWQFFLVPEFFAQVPSRLAVKFRCSHCPATLLHPAFLGDTMKRIALVFILGTGSLLGGMAATLLPSHWLTPVLAQQPPWPPVRSC